MNQKQLILSSQLQQVLNDITVLKYSLAPTQEQDLYMEWPQNQMDQMHYQIILKKQAYQPLSHVIIQKYRQVHYGKEYMRRYWVKDQFFEPYHPNQNPIERDMASWKNDCINIMIDNRIDLRGWFKVMQHAILQIKTKLTGSHLLQLKQVILEISPY